VHALVQTAVVNAGDVGMLKTSGQLYFSLETSLTARDRVTQGVLPNPAR